MVAQVTQLVQGEFVTRWEMRFVFESCGASSIAVEP